MKGNDFKTAIEKISVSTITLPADLPNIASQAKMEVES